MNYDAEESLAPRNKKKVKEKEENQGSDRTFEAVTRRLLFGSKTKVIQLGSKSMKPKYGKKK